MRTKHVAFLIVGIVLLLMLVFILVTMFTFGNTTQYVTNDISEYGKYIGNYDNESVQRFINTFFPDKIDETFSNVSYSYRAQKGDAYAFEAFLSFTINDTEQYNAFVESYTVGLTKSKFRYDDSYWEYTLADEFQPNSKESQSGDIYIRYAKIGKILCCPEKQEVIFVSLGVYDGGIANTAFLCVYFDRFHIDPREYAAYAIPTNMK